MVLTPQSKMKYGKLLIENTISEGEEISSKLNLIYS
jgi:hypothetical protein